MSLEGEEMASRQSTVCRALLTLSSLVPVLGGPGPSPRSAVEEGTLRRA